MIPDSVLLFAASALVGLLIGAVGIGGILLIPALIALAGLNPHQASATALFTFIFTGILGTLLFQRKGSIDWQQTALVCAGALIFSYAGARFNAAVAADTLIRAIALLVILAGAYVFAPQRTAGPAAGCTANADAQGRGRVWLLLAIGALAGLGSGFSGAGGPLFSVPLMVIAGFAPLSAIGTSQVLQVFSAASGTLAHLQVGQIHWPVVAWITAGELIGVIAGARLAHAVSAIALRRSAGLLCLVVGIWMLWKSL